MHLTDAIRSGYAPDIPVTQDTGIDTLLSLGIKLSF